MTILGQNNHGCVRFIGVAGGSCSGKTTFSSALLQAIGEDNGLIFSQDAYYLDQSKRQVTNPGNVNYDHPSSLDFALMYNHLISLSQGETINIPQYDFVTHQRMPSTKPLPQRNTIIIDGTLILSDPKVRSLLSSSVFFKVPEAVRLRRRIYRDTRERGRQTAGVLDQFYRHVKPMHDQFVEPSKKFADVVLNGEDQPAQNISRLLSSIGPAPK